MTKKKKRRVLRLAQQVRSRELNFMMLHHMNYSWVNIPIIVKPKGLAGSLNSAKRISLNRNCYGA